MSKKYRLLIYFVASGFLFAIDQLLKSFARANPDFTYYLWKPWLGWEYFANAGIAFSLPFPNWLVLIATPLIILGLFVWCLKAKSCKLTAVSLIITGAISNYLDRILFGATTDYLRVLTGVLNLADVLIVAGVAMLVFKNKK